MGRALDVDRAIEGCPLIPCKIWRRGEKTQRLSSRLNDQSGATFHVSEASGGQVPVQASDAIAFMKSHGPDLQKLLASDGVEHAFIDFGWDFPFDRSPYQWNHFPTELLSLCTQLGISICVSVAVCSSPCDDQEPHGTDDAIEIQRDVQDAN
jgi:hypothetical protein